MLGEQSYFSYLLVTTSTFMYLNVQILTCIQKLLKDETKKPIHKFSYQTYNLKSTKDLQYTFGPQYYPSNSNLPRSLLILFPYLYSFRLASWSNNSFIYLSTLINGIFWKIVKTTLEDYMLLVSMGTGPYAVYGNYQCFCIINPFYWGSY